MHLVRYKPDKPGVNYNLAFQSAFVLRLYENPPDQRYDLVGLESGRRSVLRMIQGPGGIGAKHNLPADVVATLAAQMFDGIMLQLRSMPVGMRIDDWIYREYPGLRGEQDASIASQQQTNVKSLAPMARAMAPPTIYNANVAMSAAYAKRGLSLIQRSIVSVDAPTFGPAHRELQRQGWSAHMADAAC